MMNSYNEYLSEMNNPNFIAIDIECAKNYNGHSEISLIGVVVADFNLNIIEKKEIYVHGNKVSKVLKDLIHIDEEKMRAAPPYKDLYGGIREIVEQPNTIYLAHNAASDIGFLTQENNRNKLFNMDCKFNDTITILKNCYQLPEYNLEAVCKEFKIEHSPHYCLSDANACIEIIRHISADKDISPLEVIKEYGLGSLVTTTDVITEMRLTRAKQGLNNFGNKKVHIESNDMVGKTICFTESFKKDFPIAAYAIAHSVVSNGGQYTDDLKQCDILLHDNNPWSMRLQYLYNNRPKTITLMSISEFLNTNEFIFNSDCFEFDVRTPDSFTMDDPYERAIKSHDYFYEKFTNEFDKCSFVFDGCDIPDEGDDKDHSI